jgi:serine/threonine-protein kinase
MTESAPTPLVDLLAALRLALPAEVESMAGRVRRLSRGLPAFEQVWVDALAQARVLTFYQAAEINAGRGRQLGVGSAVLCEPLEDLGYARVFRAREREGGRLLRVCVLPADPAEAAGWNAALAELVRKQVRANHPAIQPVEKFGLDEGRFWIACPYADARPLAEWLLHRGRMPPLAVHELARQMADALAVCHQAAIAHGDLGPRQVLVDARGQLVLPMPGVRPILRPGEGFASAALAPETYDYLAPERIADGTPVNLAADLYACGALWWHLLAGRPPIAGASGLSKMRAALTARIPALAPIAPDADPALVRAIQQCLVRNPAERPQSFAALAAVLGVSSPRSRRTLSRCALFPGQGRVVKAAGLVRTRRLAGRAAVFAAAASLLVAVASWPYWGNPWLASRKTDVKARQNAWVSRAAESPATGPRSAATQRTPAAAQAAVYQAPLRGEARANSSVVAASAVSELAVLEIGPRARASDLRLRPGITVRPRNGRAVIEVDSEGWAIATEGLTFENIDFVWQPETIPAAADMLTCRATRIRFSGCSWQLSASGGRSVAVDWQPPTEGPQRLEAAELALDDCLFRNVAAALHVTPRATLAIDVKNSLHLGPGPLVKLAAAPQAGQQIVLAASHLTLRECQGLLECPARQAGSEVGTMTVRAESCALVPSSGSGLVMFTGDDDPAELLAALRWLGQGSVVAQDIPLAVWLRGDGRRQSAAEDSVQVAGLVRTPLGFAGDRERGAEASRVVRWQVPLQSPDPPGILESRLPASAGKETRQYE